MRIFVTGASGYIGRAVCKAFRRRGHHVIGMVRKESDAKHLKKHEIQPLLSSLSEPAGYLPSIRDREVLVHCAFEYSPQGVTLDLQTLDTFIGLAEQLKLPRTLIYTSGCWVYGSSQGQWRDESSPLNPINKVKWRPPHEEKVLKSVSQWLKPIVIRPGCVFGGEGGLTADWFSSIASGKPTVPGNGSQRWPMIHVNDLAELYVLAAEKEMGSHVFNASDGRSHTILEYMTALIASQKMDEPISKLSAQETSDKYGGLAEGLLVDLLLSSEKAERLLDWKPRHPSLLDQPGIYFDAWSNA